MTKQELHEELNGLINEYVKAQFMMSSQRARYFPKEYITLEMLADRKYVGRFAKALRTYVTPAAKLTKMDDEIEEFVNAD